MTLDDRWRPALALPETGHLPIREISHTFGVHDRIVARLDGGPPRNARPRAWRIE